MLVFPLSVVVKVVGHCCVRYIGTLKGHCSADIKGMLLAKALFDRGHAQMNYFSKVCLIEDLPH